jgi:hypothetical protein
MLAFPKLVLDVYRGGQWGILGLSLLLTTRPLQEIDINPFTTFPISHRHLAVLLCPGFTSYPIVDVPLFWHLHSWMEWRAGRDGEGGWRSGLGIEVQLFLVEVDDRSRFETRLEAYPCIQP